MSDELSFQFHIPNRPVGKPITFKEAEEYLLAELQNAKEEKNSKKYEETLWQLIRLYSKTGRQNLAFEYVEQLLNAADDKNKLAGLILAQGQLMEQQGDFESAVTFYLNGIHVVPIENKHVRYLLHNNLGYSLNKLGRFLEGEEYCMTAIEIDPQRCNAYKNAGIALEGQGKLGDAAEMYIKATQKEASDARSLRLLEDLVSRNPALFVEVDGLENKLEQCRKWVKIATGAVDKMMEPIVITERILKDPRGPIESFEWGRFIINGVEHAKGINEGKNLRIIGEDVTKWKEYKTGNDHHVTIEKVTGLADKGIEVLIFGIGVNGMVRIDNSVYAYIRDTLGIGEVITERTPQACFSFNEMYEKGRRVALLVHGTC